MGMDFGQSLESRVVTLLENGQIAEAVNLATQSANSGDPEGMCVLAQMYYHGAGMIQDVEMAVHWYKRAADAGYPEAMYEYAVFCAEGECVPKSMVESNKYMLQAANLGYAPAEFQMGLRCADEEKYQEAFSWYMKAAKQGVPGAQLFAGESYEYGEGVEQNLSEALNWYRAAADQGNTDAMVSAAKILGALVANFTYQPDEEMFQEAFHWLSKAVEAGNLEAHFFLAVMYLDGLGVQQNDKLAYEYLKLAADAGHEQSKEFLSRFRRNIYGDYYFT